MLYKQNHLKIPYALTENKKPVSPQTAEKGEKVFCPECDTRVNLRKGDIRQHHFAHKPDTRCSGESILHKVAKRIIIYAWNNPRNLLDPHHDPSEPCEVYIFRKCRRCGAESGGNILVGDIGDVTDIREEVEVGNKRVDVVVIDKLPQFGIEIRNTHAVPDEKWDTFANYKFPCIEVEAEQVIKSWENRLKDPPSFRALFLKPVQNNFHLDPIREQRHRYDCQKCNPELFEIL